MNSHQSRRAVLAATTGTIAILTNVNVAAFDGIDVIPLVSDIPGVAPVTDLNLVNPWGITSSATSPLWISDNGSGFSTVYNGAGQPFPLPPNSPIVVQVPPDKPTGIVFNGSSTSFLVGGSPARFIFDTETGALAAWTSGGTATTQKTPDDNTVYKGLAIGTSSGGDTLYAADFKGGKIDTFNNTFGSTSLTGNFSDPNLPAGYAPFNIQNIGGQLYVTYALQDADKEDDVSGPGHGFVDIFDLNGVFQKRLISQGALDSPWGLAIAPNSFGPFAGDLLVGNFGDGRINAYDPTSGALIGPLKDSNGNPIEIEGLWGLRVGNGGNGGSPNEIFFTAGIAGDGEKEDHGLFGALAPVPDAGASTGVLLGVTVIGAVVSRRKA